MNITRTQHAAQSRVEARRIRQTPKRIDAFEAVLRGGSRVLLAGASLAGRAVGLPLLSAAVAPGAARAGSSLTTGGGEAVQGEEALKQLHEQRVQDDLKLLALQTQIQQQNRQVSLVSNVMRAKHETAKSAIANIRA